MDADSHTVKLPESVDIKQIEQLYRELTEHIQQRNSLGIDCSQVQSIDTAGLQLLLVCQQEFLKQSKTFHIINASPIVIGTIA
ncbi:STAS domain-containing protein [Spartinivicinus ruber]|uniref:STAS domain-containing protein n=1 Tax=Spartinivicinus ruber TaxID=2683272 RepID=UPI0013D70D5B|nr:STAS domain-containing protein [Spartinivicinus ruber]